MQQLSLHQILDIWEVSAGKSALHFAIKIICKAFPNIDRNTAFLLPIGTRDTLLLQIRNSIFGTSFNKISVCPSCHEKVEWQININDFQLPESIDCNPNKLYDFVQKGYKARYRLINTNDILSVNSINNIEKQTEVLLSNCLHEIKFKNSTKRVRNLPAEILMAISENMEKNDALANIDISLTCPQCNHHWNTTFDIISYLWSEIDSLAQQLLYEVGIIASHFGWSEEQILNLSAKRRATYIEMLT